MTTLAELATLARAEQGLAIISTLRADTTIQSSLVNVAVMKHPLTGEDTLAFVTYGKVKLSNLRKRPSLTVAVRSGWQWAALEGEAQIIGPDDPHPDVDAERLRLLLRSVFASAGGTHENWDEYDRVMQQDRRSVVLVSPTRVYSN